MTGDLLDGDKSGFRQSLSITPLSRVPSGMTPLIRDKSIRTDNSWRATLEAQHAAAAVSPLQRSIRRLQERNSATVVAGVGSWGGVHPGTDSRGVMTHLDLVTRCGTCHDTTCLTVPCGATVAGA